MISCLIPNLITIKLFNLNYLVYIESGLPKSQINKVFSVFDINVRILFVNEYRNNNSIQMNLTE